MSEKRHKFAASKWKRKKEDNQRGVTVTEET